MSADKVNTAVGNCAEIAGVALVDVNLAFGRLVIKINLFSASLKSSIVYINADNIPVKKFRLDKSCPTARKLIENKVVLL